MRTVDSRIPMGVSPHTTQSRLSEASLYAESFNAESKARSADVRDLVTALAN